MTTFGVAGDENFVQRTIFPFQWENVAQTCKESIIISTSFLVTGTPLIVIINIYAKGNCLTSSEPWSHHQMDTFSALLVICAGNSPVTGRFSAQRPVSRSFDIFFDLRLTKRLSKQWWGWWFEKPSRSLWRHCNVHWIGYVVRKWSKCCSPNAMSTRDHIS